MANDITKEPWLFDTANAATIYFKNGAKIASVKWVSESASAGHNAVIQDRDGRVLWEGVASGSNYEKLDLLGGAWWPDGFKIATLQSGTLYVTPAGA